MPVHEYKDWKYIRRVDLDAGGKVVKIRSAFKGDDNAAVEEIQSIIDNQVKQLEGVLGK